MAAKSMYVYLALLLLVGTQLATSKSVDGTFTDDLNSARTLSLSKRQAAAADEESSDEPETTTTLDLESTTLEELSTPETVTKPKIGDEPVSTSNPDEEDEAPTTVKPLSTATDKPKKQKKPKPTTTPPSLLNRIDPQPISPVNVVPTGPGLIVPGVPPPMPYVPPPFNNGYFPPAAAAGPSFAPWPLNIPQLSPVPAPYDYPHPSGPAFSETPAGSSAFAGSFASASASAGGTGGTVSTSISPGGSASSSHSGGQPGGVSAQQSASSFSSSGGPFPGAGQAGFRPQAPGGNVNLRGSFGDDDESVGIEVNGPEPAGGVPAYPSAGAGYPQNGAPIGGQGYPYAPNPYQNTIPQYPYGNVGPQYNPYGPQYNNFPNSGPYNTYPNQVFDFQEFFRRIQAQNLEFQRQINAQIEAQQRAIFDQFNQVDSRFGDTAGGGSPSNGPQSAIASASIGPQGGFLTGAISPTGPNIMNRFAETLPAPSGNSVGVFSSSSSSSFTGPDGKPISRKTVTTGVNDNGKVTVKTVHDP